MPASCRSFSGIIFADVLESHVLVSGDLVNHVGDAHSACRFQSLCRVQNYVPQMFCSDRREGKPIPRENALTKIIMDNMKTISDARPNKPISFLTTRWPTIAAKNARTVKKRAAKVSDRKNDQDMFIMGGTEKEGRYHMVQGTGSRGSILRRTWKMRTSLQRWL